MYFTIRFSFFCKENRCYPFTPAFLIMGVVVMRKRKSLSNDWWGVRRCFQNRTAVFVHTLPEMLNIVILGRIFSTVGRCARLVNLDPVSDYLSHCDVNWSL